MLDDGTGKCWGDTEYLSATPGANLGGDPDSPAVGDFPNEMTQLQPLSVGIGRKIKVLTAGRTSGALLDDGSVKIWGANADGEAGTTGAFVGLTPEALGALPPIDLGSGAKVKAVAIGDSHECAILDNSTLKCWGSGAEGKLGLGSTDDKGSAAGTMGDALPTVYLEGHGVRQVAVGSYHTCVIVDDGTLKCWGSNRNGLLGLGDTRNRGDAGGQLSTDTTVDLSF